MLYSRLFDAIDNIHSYARLPLEHLCLYMVIIVQNRSDLIKDLLLLEDYSELEYFLRRN
jgi:translation initiation factor 2 gamma subunit (eIF-2gamma)